MELQGKLAVVTGASRGLGRQLALALAREGYDLAICARDEGKLAEVGAEVVSLGAKCDSFSGDLGNDHILTAHKVWLASLPSIEVLINNASYVQPLGPLDLLDPLEDVLSFQINLHVPVAFIRSVLPSMRKKSQGTIINICSLSGRRAIRNMSLYCASKFALRGLTEAVAQELEGSGVRCWSCSPGGMNTKTRSDLFGVADAQRQQGPEVAAKHIVDALAGRLAIPNGADLVVRHGDVWVIQPELWESGEIIPAIRRVVHYKARVSA